MFWFSRLYRQPQFLGRWMRVLTPLILGMTLGALALAVVLAGDIYEYQDTVDGVHLPEVDAIVCLAGGRGRIAAAGDLWYRYWEQDHRPMVLPTSYQPKKTPILYLSGMGPQSDWRALTHQLRRGVLDVIKPDQVVLEKESYNTEANARWLLNHARQKGWRRILLMTSPYHMKRSRYIFEGVLRDASYPLQIETLSVFQEPFEPGEWRGSLHGVRVTLNEFLKWVYYKSFWKP